MRPLGIKSAWLTRDTNPPAARAWGFSSWIVYFDFVSSVFTPRYAMPSLPYFSLRRRLAAKDHDNDTRWITTNKFPPNTYGALYDPDLATRSNLVNNLQRLIQDLRPDAKHEPVILVGWHKILDGSTFTKRIHYNHRLRDVPEQDLGELLVVSQTPGQSVQLEDTRTFQEFNQLYEHYKSMMGYRRLRRKTTFSQPGCEWMDESTAATGSVHADETQRQKHLKWPPPLLRIRRPCRQVPVPAAE